MVEAGPDLDDLEDDLHYTHADAVRTAFGDSFAAGGDVEPYLCRPKVSANRVYAGRLGNGDEASGDGWRFRGRGLIRIVGKGDYARFGAAIGLGPVQAADYCATPEGAALAGCWFLKTLNALADADNWNLAALTRAVDGPCMYGATDRAAYANRLLDALTGAPANDDAAPGYRRVR